MNGISRSLAIINKHFKKVFITGLFSPVIISVIITGIFQIYTTKSQINQIYNQNIIIKREELIDKTVHLVSLSRKYEDEKMLYHNSKKDMYQTLMDVLKQNYPDLSHPEFYYRKILDEYHTPGNKLSVDPLDKFRIDTDESKMNEAVSYMNDREVVQNLWETALNLQILVPIYFGPKTTAAFSYANNIYNARSTESSDSFNNGEALMPCLTAMKEELDYNLK